MRFTEDSAYNIDAGETKLAVFDLDAMTVEHPMGIGYGSFLKMGELKGIKFEAVLIRFDFTLSEEDIGKTVSYAELDLPVRLVQDTLFSLKVAFYELLEDFSEEDSITAVPPLAAGGVPDSNGTVPERLLNIQSSSYNLDPILVNDWLEGTKDHRGIAIVPNEIPASPGIVEMNARDYGSDPPVVRVEFTDGSTANYAAEADYSIATFTTDGLDCVGGVATRVYFEFDIEGLDDRAMIHYSSLVLTVDNELSLGASPGEESLLELPTNFYYYLYTPGSGDYLDQEFFSGTGVNAGDFDPYETETVRIPLVGFIPDVAEGERENTGLVFQSDLEGSRFQRVSFFGVDADSLAPRLEIIYSLPADFSGNP